MAVLIDAMLATSFLTTPVREGWFDGASAIQVKAGLSVSDITEDDIALVPAPEATLLTRTHVIDRSVAIVHDGTGIVSMRTPVRADEVDEAVVSLTGVGAAGEVLTRALLKPYFGITATAFVRDQETPEDATVVISEGAEALAEAPEGFQEELTRTWFIMTGKPYVSHVTVAGVRALARDADEQLALLRAALETGYERRRDVRRMIREATGVDQDALAEVTGKMRFAMEPEDQEPLRLLIERGTWGTHFGRSLPAYRDQLGLTNNTGDTDGE